jgi:enamine deaminase RidA (YjgF/YER057c/UK114 family)
MSCRRIDAINKICGRAQRSALIRRQVQQLRARGEQMSSNIVRHQSDSRLSRIVTHNGTVYLAGLTADDRSATMKAQTEEVLKKIDDLLKIAGTNKSRLLSAMVYVSDMRLKPQMDEAWIAWLDSGNTPVRACVETRLGTPDTLVEIVVVAAQLA